MTLRLDVIGVVAADTSQRVSGRNQVAATETPGDAGAMRSSQVMMSPFPG